MSRLVENVHGGDPLWVVIIVIEEDLVREGLERVHLFICTMQTTIKCDHSLCQSGLFPYWCTGEYVPLVACEAGMDEQAGFCSATLYSITIHHDANASGVGIR